MIWSEEVLNQIVLIRLISSDVNQRKVFWSEGISDEDISREDILRKVFSSEEVLNTVNLKWSESIWSNIEWNN